MPIRRRTVEFASLPRGYQDGLDPALRSALIRLTTLYAGYEGVAAVVATGPRAIAPLTLILRHTESSGIFEVRSRAIAALAALGADEVLIDFIEADHTVADPTARTGEEAAVSIAARALKGSRHPRAFMALLKLARQRPLPGAMEALGAFRRPEAIPGLIRGLEEDDARAAAADGLQTLGRASRNALIAVASEAGDDESALRKRRTALRVLADIGLAPWQRADIRPLIDHLDDELSLQACRALIRVADAPDRAACQAQLTGLAQRLRPPLNALAAEAAGLAASPAKPGSVAAPAPLRDHHRKPLLRLNLAMDASEEAP